MLAIQALTYNDLPPVVPVAGSIPEDGGTVGRGPGNALILPDPMKLVSRVHLQISPHASGGYRIKNVSSANSVLVNGKELEASKSCAINDQDKITIGGYVLQVTELVADEAPGVPPRVAAAPIPAPDDDDEDDLLKSWADIAPAAQPEEAMPAADGPDPFAIIGKSSQSDLARMEEENIGLDDLADKDDELINGPIASGAVRELFQDTLTGPEFERVTPEQDLSLDPLALFTGDGGILSDLLQPEGGARPAVDSAASSVDLTHGSELEGLFHTPKLKNDPVASATKETRPDPQDEPDDLDRFFEDLEPGNQKKSKPAPEPEPVAKPAAKAEAAKPATTAKSPAAAKPAATKSAPTTKPAAAPKTRKKAASAENSEPAQDAATPDELYAAFLEGLGIESIPGRTEISPDFMRLVGQLLQGYVQGTQKLIAGRAVVKQEVRASVTLIAPERNNPLKFSPDAEVALMHLLGNQIPGFLGPVEAVQQAFADLRAHQIGIISGMQSALNYVLDCFNPSVIGDGSARGMLGNMLAIWRKAKLWDAYGSYFLKTRENAADHFQSFFGAAFREAYEKTISESRGKDS